MLLVGREFLWTEVGVVGTPPDNVIVMREVRIVAIRHDEIKPLFLCTLKAKNLELCHEKLGIATVM